MQLKAEKPDLPFGEVGKELGARWKDISDKDKKVYEEKAAKDKARCESFLHKQDSSLWLAAYSKLAFVVHTFQYNCMALR